MGREFEPDSWEGRLIALRSEITTEAWGGPHAGPRVPLLAAAEHLTEAVLAIGRGRRAQAQVEPDY